MTKGLSHSLSRVPLHLRGVVKPLAALKAPMGIVVEGGSGNGIGSTTVIGIPPGKILYFGAGAQVQISGRGTSLLADDWSGQFGFGTSPISGTTLDGDEINVIDSTAIGPAVAEVSPTTLGLLIQSSLIQGPATVHFNLLIINQDISGDVTVDLSGVFSMAYSVLSQI